MTFSLVQHVMETAHDLTNYTNWFPEEHRHLMPQIPRVSLWDLRNALWCAIAISLVRYFIVQPFFTWMAIRTIPLSRYSLAEVNAQRRQSVDYIPPFVFPLLERFLEHQAEIMKKAKKSGRPDVVIDGKMKTQREWKEVEKAILARLPAEGPAPPQAYTEEDVRKWLSAVQHDQARSMKLKKFMEAGWQLTFYSFIWIFGLITISDKPYFTKSVHLVWDNYPLEPPSADVTWYYHLSMGHYIHLFCAQFFDIKRKDFTEMIVHHVVTLLLLSFSWMVNFSRIGALVLAVHDGCDVFLQLAKVLNYTHHRTLTDVCFVVFAVCFFVCRLVIFPSRIIYTCLVWTVTEGGYKPWFVYYFFNALLISLQVLHIIWFWIIFEMAWRWLTTGEMKKDARSDTDDGSASENEGQAAKQVKAGVDKHNGAANSSNKKATKKVQ